MKVLPHRYPFLLVDRILEIEHGKRIVGLKNVTINEPFFQGHFPGHPIMPGVLIIEAMAQVGGMLLMGVGATTPETKVVYFMSLDNVKLRRPVKPGDQLRFELELVQIRGTDVQDERRREGRRRGRVRGGDGAPWCATNERRTLAIHPTAIVSPRCARSATNVEIGAFAIVGDGLHRRRRLRRSRRARRSSGTSRSAPNVKVGIGTIARRRSAGSQVQGRAHVGRDRRRHAIREYTHDQPRHGAVVQDDGREGTVSSCRTCISRTTVTWATASSSRTGRSSPGTSRSRSGRSSRGSSAVHQFVTIGRHSFIGGCSRVAKDVPPFMKAVGNPVKLYGLNSVGLQRSGFPDETCARAEARVPAVLPLGAERLAGTANERARSCSRSPKSRTSCSSSMRASAGSVILTAARTHRRHRRRRARLSSRAYPARRGRARRSSASTMRSAERARQVAAELGVQRVRRRSRRCSTPSTP